MYPNKNFIREKITVYDENIFFFQEAKEKS